MDQEEAEKRNADQVKDPDQRHAVPELSLLSMSNDERARAVALRYAEVDAMSAA